MDKTIVNFEIPVEDIDRLKDFYEKLFGGKLVYSELPDMPTGCSTRPPPMRGGMPQAPGII
jgi:predicted enzyme related to lactoylglutathione lyase